MNSATEVPSEGAKIVTKGWGFPFIPDFSSLWGKYRTSRVDEFDKADGFDVDVHSPAKAVVATSANTDINDTTEPEYTENSLDDQVKSCLNGNENLDENAYLNKGKRGRNKKQHQGEVAPPKLNEPTRRSKRIKRNVSKNEGVQADTMETRFEKKNASFGHRSKNMKNKSPQPHVFLKQNINVSHHCDLTPQRYCCPHCTKACGSEHHLRAHLVSKHNPSPNPLQVLWKVIWYPGLFKEAPGVSRSLQKSSGIILSKTEEVTLLG